MPMWLLFALGTAFLWACGQVLSKKGFENISPLWNNIFANLVGLCIWVPFALIATHFSLHIPSVGILVLIFLTGACYMSYFYAISKGNLALTGTIFELYPIFTILLSFFFLHERVLLVQTVGIGLSILGGIVIAWPEHTKKISELSWVVWGLFGAALEGIGDFFAKITVVKIGPFEQMFFLVVLFQIVSVANFTLDKKGRALPKFTLKNFFPSVVGSGLVVMGTSLLFFALQTGKASLVTPITAISPALFVTLAIIFLKEKITKRQIAGIIAVIVGVILVGI